MKRIQLQAHLSQSNRKENTFASLNIRKGWFTDSKTPLLLHSSSSDPLIGSRLLAIVKTSILHQQLWKLVPSQLASFLLLVRMADNDQYNRHIEKTPSYTHTSHSSLTFANSSLRNTASQSLVGSSHRTTFGSLLCPHLKIWMT